MLKKIFKFEVNVWVAIPLILFTWFWFSTKQTRGIESAQRHVNKITPEWQAFQKENPRFRKVRFGAGTAKNGCVLVVGYVIGQEDYRKVFQYIENTDPPRPIDSWLKVLPDEEIFNEMFPIEEEKRAKLDIEDGSTDKSVKIYQNKHLPVR